MALWEAFDTTKSFSSLARSKNKKEEEPRVPKSPFKVTLQEDAKILSPMIYTELGTKPLIDGP